MTRWLVIMAKAPVMGQVKTRLGKAIGLVQATWFYRRMINRTVRRLGYDPRWSTRLVVTPDSAVAGGAWPRGVPVMGQGPGDLGQRMRRIFQTLPSGPVVIIGTDIPDIEPVMIKRAFQRLGDHDSVFGPADDGGYWLLGLARRNALPRAILTGVRWSTPHALEDTADSLGGYSVAQIDTLCDVDCVADFAKCRLT